jgi:hypothetical protein
MDAKETIERDFERCWKEEWESGAKEILEKQDMKKLKELCGEIFSMASGEFLAFLGDKVKEWRLEDLKESMK